MLVDPPIDHYEFQSVPSVCSSGGQTSLIRMVSVLQSWMRGGVGGGGEEAGFVILQLR